MAKNSFTPAKLPDIERVEEAREDLFYGIGDACLASLTQEDAARVLEYSEMAIANVPELEEGHTAKVTALLALGRIEEAVTAAGFGLRQAGGTAIALAQAHALRAAGRSEESLGVLLQAVEDGADVRAAREAALHAMYLKGDSALARTLCRKGLADRTTGVPAGAPGPTADDLRLARYELTTLHLRLCSVEEQDMAIRALEADRMPLADRLFATAFSCWRQGYDRAARLFESALSLEPFHPGGWYDLATLRQATGNRTGALEALSNAVGEGEYRLLGRVKLDPDLAPLADAVKIDRRKSLALFQVRPSYDPVEACLTIRQGEEKKAYREWLRLRCRDSWLHYVLRLRPGHRVSSNGFGLPEELPRQVILSSAGDRSCYHGWEFHCALRRLAEIVDDAHWFMEDWNIGGHLEEIAITDGRLHVRRTAVGHDSSDIVDELLVARAQIGAQDRLLRHGIARRFLGYEHDLKYYEHMAAERPGALRGREEELMRALQLAPDDPAVTSAVSREQGLIALAGKRTGRPD